jgi:ubiquinone/menaquinone biosynthesis C-methylase UbiE
MIEDIIYDNHEEEWDNCLNDEEANKKALTWLRQEDTLDRWRHNRVYSLVEPIIKFEKKFQWLTVGDGRYGTDANALLSLGADKVVCTDISDKLLKIGNEAGFIEDYAAENAEFLSFKEGEFDFVFCKEAYHHFPRPHIALHEMLRVCNVGVILIEPNDSRIDHRILNRLLPLIKILLGKKGNGSMHNFEPVGNYVFAVSKRELEKIQLGMHRRFIAYHFINDYYESGFEFISLNSSNSVDKRKIFKTKLLISMRDILTRLGLITPGLLVSILFKSEPDKALLKALTSSGWAIKELPHNPYLKN